MVFYFRFLSHPTMALGCPTSQTLIHNQELTLLYLEVISRIQEEGGYSLKNENPLLYPSSYLPTIYCGLMKFHAHPCELKESF